jgi:NADP-dependent 3-hydroxy acid dehydrogenase YdfG
VADQGRAAPGILEGRIALVTGASGGVGGAIATALGRCGARLILVGRNERRLGQAAERAVMAGAPPVESFAIDMTDDERLEDLSESLRDRFGALDILVHCAGVYERGKIGDAAVAHFDRQYRANLHAPYILTQLTLPLLARKGGDIVFVNSTQGASASPEVGAYAATHHGRKAFAESLQAEVNKMDIRVLSIFLGRTATARQERVFSAENRPYRPELLVQPEDVAEIIIATLSLPRRAEVVSMTLRPSLKSY